MKILKRFFGATDQNITPAEEPDSTVCAATDIGRMREINEDYFLIRPEKKLYIVADGMGGHNAGEVASKEAALAIDEYFSTDKIADLTSEPGRVGDEMKSALLKSNRHLISMAAANRQYQGMGCAIMVALVVGNDVHLSHVGDTRAYLSNDSGIQLLTTDHSTVMSLVQSGQMTMEEARISPLKNELTQAIGAFESIDPDYISCALNDGDRILICSDGLWDLVTDQEIHHIVHQHKDLRDICNELIESANSAGGHDNITAMIFEAPEGTVTAAQGDSV